MVICISWHCGPRYPDTRSSQSGEIKDPSWSLQMILSEEMPVRFFGLQAGFYGYRIQTDSKKFDAIISMEFDPDGKTPVGASGHPSYIYVWKILEE